MNENALYEMNISPSCYPNFQLAKAYIPFQHLNCVYHPVTGLYKGTMFPELYRPYGLDPEYVVDQ